MFDLTDEQREKLNEWLGDRKKQYTGAIGGALTYEFTPTTIGLVTKVTWMRGSKNEDTIDLTDYDIW